MVLSGSWPQVPLISTSQMNGAPQLLDREARPRSSASASAIRVFRAFKRVSKKNRTAQEHIYVHIYIYTHMYTYIYIYIYRDVSLYIYVHVYVWIMCFLGYPFWGWLN